MKNQWRHNELHLESCQTLVEGCLACRLHCVKQKAVYTTRHVQYVLLRFQKTFTKGEIAFKQPLFWKCTVIYVDVWYVQCVCIGVWIRVCLFPSVLRNSIITPPLSPTNISRVLAASLHTACLTKPFRVLYLFSVAPHQPFPFPLSLPPYGNISSGETRRCEEVQKASAVFPYGLASDELCTQHHMLKRDMQVNMHTLYFRSGNLHAARNLLTGKNVYCNVSVF